MKYLIILIILIHLSVAADMGDWPQWRNNSGHTSVTSVALPSDLEEDWTWNFGQRSQTWDDPLNNDLMTYDKLFEPVVAQGIMYLAFNDCDKIISIDTATGKLLWTFYAEGPIRLAPLVWEKRLYFCCDDGRLYCLNALTGKLEWVFNGAPYSTKSLGNGRVISAWPARGGVVIDEGRLYFSTSIWPFMGIFIYCINPENGQEIWHNSGSGFNYQLQPHNAPSFAGIAPQGILTVSGDYLIIPGGRSLPAIYNKNTGEFLYFSHTGKFGGSFVAANENYYFVHTRKKEVRGFCLKGKELGEKTELSFSEPVLDGNNIYSWKDNKISHYYKGEIKESLKCKPVNDLIKCGDFLYAATSEGVEVIHVPDMKCTKTISYSGSIQRLIAASKRLFAVTLDGKVISFSNKGKPQQFKLSKVKLKESDYKFPGYKYLESKEGYALVSNVSEKTILSLIQHTSFKIAVLDKDSKKINTLRKKFDEAGLYGTRVSIHDGDIQSFSPPAYIFNIVIIGEDKLSEKAIKSVRPYGGLLVIPKEVSPLGNDKKMVRLSDPSMLVLKKEGPLAGSADWSHMYGDIANSVKSDDKLVKLPLGVLWFGGNTNIDVLPRHGHGPPQQVVNGRLIIEGIDLLSARDVYTGRVLWKKKFPDLGNKGVYFDDSYKDSPLSTDYNQKHIPGANGRGTNYIVAGNEVYVVTGDRCQVVDAETGHDKHTIFMLDEKKQKSDWAFIGVYKDYLIGGVNFANYSKYDKSKKINTWNKNVDLSASIGIVVFNRFSGKELWRVKSNYSYIHNGIVAGNDKLYCLDRLPRSYEKLLLRRGADFPSKYNISCFDIKNGKRLWQDTNNIIGSFLSYSKEYDILLQSGASARDRSDEEAKEGMLAYNGSTGELLWQDLKRKYAGPCMLHGKTIITNASTGTSSGSYDLITGKEHLIKNPLTGKMEKWKFKRHYGCNTVIASEYLLTFRSGAAGFYDLNTHSGTGNFGGFKSSCTSNLVAANGILNAPDYTRTCSCSYQNQTSLGLIYMPELDYWTTARPNLFRKNKDLQRVGINFGAPGDRIENDGTLWVDYPSVGGDKINLPIEVKGGKTTYSFTNQGSGNELPWVFSSSLLDVEKIILQTRPGKIELELYINNLDKFKDSTFSIFINGQSYWEKVTPTEPRVFKRTLHIKDKLEILFHKSIGRTLISGLKIEYK